MNSNSPKMTTAGIATALAAAAKRFPLLGKIEAYDVLDVVKWELGHEAILDDFQSYAGHRAMAFGPGTILHVISGNTPHAGLQSLMRGLLLRSRNLCKIPSAGLPEIELFRDALPDSLKSRVEISRELPPRWIEESDAVIVFGSDETVEHFRRLVRADQRFIAHGHKFSIGIVFDDPALATPPLAARDASLFDQQGCLSPHAFYVDESGGLSARKYAALLAREMERFNQTLPRSKISAQESAAILGMRSEHEFRAANGDAVEIWKSPQGTDWTVIYDEGPRFTASCLNRVIFVKPLPANIDDIFPRAGESDARRHLSTVAIWPSIAKNAKRLRPLGAIRICPIGSMQNPPFTWHQDGGQNLAPLVTWGDWE